LKSETEEGGKAGIPESCCASLRARELRKCTLLNTEVVTTDEVLEEPESHRQRGDAAFYFEEKSAVIKIKNFSGIRPMPRRRVFAVWIGVIMSVMLPPANAGAHDLNSSYSAIVVTPDSLQAVFTFDISDLKKNFSLDANGDTKVDRDELLAAMPGIYDYVEEHAAIAIDFLPAKLERRPGGFTQDDFGNVFINFNFVRPLTALPAEISVRLDFFEKFGAQHKNLAKIVAGEQMQQAIFTEDSQRQRFVIGGDISLFSQIGAFIKLGVEHIFLGYDHIMFLFALIVIGGRLLDLVKIVTAFTVAHSITLILAALEILQLPPRLIESGIALSIAYVAAENFVIDQSNHRWILTFMFGLVHGFGFANVLRDLGLPTTGLVPSLLAFNVGVEIGQLCMVAVFFPITLWIAKQKFQRRVVFAFSSVILLFGLAWFVERAFGLAFMPL
jgi:hypothetical protein